MAGYGKKNALVWEQKKSQIAYGPIKMLAFAVSDFFAWNLLISALLLGLKSLDEKLNLNLVDELFLRGILIVCVIVYDFLIPFLKNKTKKYIYVISKVLAVILGLGAVGGIIVLQIKSRFYILESGMNYIYAEYLRVFNEFYSRRFILPECDIENVPAFLSLVMSVSIILLWILIALFNLRWLIALLPILEYAMLFYVGLTPDWISVSLFSIAVIILLSFNMHKGRRGVRTLRWRDGKAVYKQPEFVQTVTITLAILLFWGFVTTSLKNTAEDMVEGRDLLRVQQNLIDAYNSLRRYEEAKKSLETKYTISNEPPTFLDKEMCFLTTDELVSNNIYLREYIGADYKDNTWDYNKSEFEKAVAEKGFDINKVRFLVEGHVFGTIANDEMIKSGFVSTYNADTVEYKLEYGEGSAIAFLAPYYFDATEGKSELSEDVLPLKNRFSRETSFTAFKSSTLDSHDIAKLRAVSLSEEDEAILTWYDGYVKEHYLDVPDNIPTAKSAAEYLKSLLFVTNNINNYRVAASEYASIVLSTYTYDWNLDKNVKGKDLAEYFLNVSHRGHNEHFATSAAMVLRSMGIPARFAKGYVVSGDAFTKTNDKKFTTTVLDRDKHAWIEIYLDHIGWMPVECTPSYTVRDNIYITGQEEKHLLERPTLKAGSEDLSEYAWLTRISVGEGDDLSLDFLIPNVKEAEDKPVDWSQLSSKPAEKRDDEISKGAVADKDSDKQNDSQTDSTGKDDSSDTSSDSGNEVGSETDENGTEEKGGAVADDSSDKYTHDGLSDDEESKDSSVESAEEETKNSSAESAEESKEDKPKDEETLNSDDKSASSTTDEDTDVLNPPENEDELIVDYSPLFKVIKGVLSVIGSVLILALIVLFARKSVKKHQLKLIEKEFAKGAYSSGVNMLNRKLYLDLRLIGKIIKLNCTDKEYEDTLKQTYDFVSHDEFDKFMSICKEAAFANYEVSKENAEFCLAIFKKIREYKKKKEK